MHGIIIFIKLCCLFVTMASAFKLYTFFFLWIDFHVFNQIQWFFLLHVPTLFISLSSCLSFLWITVFLPSFLIFAILSFFFFYCVTFSLLLLLLRFFDLSNGMVNAPFCASSPKINIHFASRNCCRFAWYLCHYCAFEWFPMKIGNWIVCVWLSREVYRSVCCRQRQNENAIRSIEAFDSAPTIQFLSLFCFVWFGSVQVLPLAKKEIVAAFVWLHHWIGVCHWNHIIHSRPFPSKCSIPSDIPFCMCIFDRVSGRTSKRTLHR